jgi:glycosyltransferase involved in cell wall biosynthesis
VLQSRIGEALLRCKKRVGYWFWETSNFPQRWAHRANYLDEIWAATHFVADAIRKKTDTPVEVLPPAVTLGKVTENPRAHYSIPDNRTVFLNIFDSNSFTGRKNPLGLIDACQRAMRIFPEFKDKALLAIKTTNLTPETRIQLLERAADLPFALIDRYLARDELLGLIAASDCYIALHRAEGLGLPLIEAMMLGKPTIATGYSGNVDFMNEGNSFLVKYEIVPAIGEVGPYHGSCWADPDINDAAEKILKVLQDRDAAQAIAERGQADVREYFSPETCSRRMAERIEELCAG